MSQELQSKFLKLLESPVDRGSWTDSGSRGGLHIISATKTNLVERIEQAAFRKDLYYRLYGLQLNLVPLAKRADKEQMIYNVLDEENKSGISVHFSEAALERLLSHPWEGNFIELHLALRTALAMADGDEIRVEHLPAAFGLEYEAAPDTDSHALDEQSERSALVAALQRNRWNVSKTSARLKVSRNTLYRKMKELRIPKKTD